MNLRFVFITVCRRQTALEAVILHCTLGGANGVGTRRGCLKQASHMLVVLKIYSGILQQTSSKHESETHSGSSHKSKVSSEALKLSILKQGRPSIQGAVTTKLTCTNSTELLIAG
jgi:hypothetical protein